MFTSAVIVLLCFCSFRTGKGIGYSAHFSGPMLVLECTVKTGKRENKVLHHLVKFEFHPQKVITLSILINSLILSYLDFFYMEAELGSVLSIILVGRQMNFGSHKF